MYAWKRKIQSYLKQKITTVLQASSLVKAHKENAFLRWLRTHISKLVHLLKAPDVNQQKFWWILNENINDKCVGIKNYPTVSPSSKQLAYLIKQCFKC